MKSMTAFGHAEQTFESMDVAVEIRTVNSRYLDINPKISRELMSREADLRREVQRWLKRGRVEVYITVRPKTAAQLELDEPLLKNYLDLADQINAAGGQGALEVSQALQLPGVVVSRGLDLSQEEVAGPIFQVVGQALERVLLERQKEGRRLREDLQQRTASLTATVEKIGGLRDGSSGAFREKLLQKVQALGQGMVDEGRLAQEVVYYAERSDIAEELTRLDSHLGRFRQLIEEAEEESVGKNLDFLCQEMNREMNTILSKSHDMQISNLGVQGKAEIEKIREQVQNVE